MGGVKGSWNKDILSGGDGSVDKALLGKHEALSSPRIHVKGRHGRGVHNHSPSTPRLEVNQESSHQPEGQQAWGMHEGRQENLPEREH